MARRCIVVATQPQLKRDKFLERKRLVVIYDDLDIQELTGNSPDGTVRPREEMCHPP